MKLFLGGGGGAATSVALDQAFAAAVGTGGRLLYLPIALAPGHPLWAGRETWIVSTFAPLGLTMIETWDEQDLAARAGHVDLGSFAGVYIGGGNTYRLLYLLRQAGALDPLRSFAESGRPIYGGSAGAILLGRSIAIAGEFGDSNDDGVESLDALDLLRDERNRSMLVLPHYTPDWRPRAQIIANAMHVPVIGIPEDAGVIVDGTARRTVGSGPVVMIVPEEP